MEQYRGYMIETATVDGRQTFTAIDADGTRYPIIAYSIEMARVMIDRWIANAQPEAFDADDLSEEEAERYG